MNIEDTTARKLIPRWHSIMSNARGHSFARSTTAESSVSARHQVLKQYYETWRDNPSLGAALEVLDRVSMLSNLSLVVAPLKQIVLDENAPGPAKLLANRYLRGENGVEGSFFGQTDEERIRTLKSLCAQYPRNALLQVEKARSYTFLGQHDAAAHSFAIALASAPGHRTVLRAYSRFKVHLGKPEEARWQIIRDGDLENDPWLQASEISLSELIGKKPKSAGYCRKLLSTGRLRPRSTTEASASLATLELSHGKVRLARRLFQESLVDPTDNVISQFEWVRAAKLINFPESEVRHANTVDPEVRYYNALRLKDWAAALGALEAWQAWEPYSSRIAVSGSYLASIFLADHVAAARICAKAYTSNNNDPILLNNYAVSLIQCGNMEEARPLIEQAKCYTHDWVTDPTINATMGLLNYRSGDFEKGASYYARAVKLAQANAVKSTHKDEAYSYAIRAIIHWVYEEYYSGGAGGGEALSLMGDIKKRASKLSKPESIIDAIDAFSRRIADKSEMSVEIKGRTLTCPQSLSSSIKLLG